MIPLKPTTDAPVPCKICRQPAAFYGAVDFNRCCIIPGGVTLPPAGDLVAYRRCKACGFLFTDAFDDWSAADFEAHIYNDAYRAVDPDYAEVRPRNNAMLVQQLFGADKANRRVLDYGGGNGVLCAQLRAAGFPLAVTYDPFVPAYAEAPAGDFDVVTSFETLEHMPDPPAGIGAIAAKLADPGLVLFSTLLQPPDIDRLGLGWWYVGPRNGHVSLFSRNALVCAWRQHGCQTGSFNDNLHVAFRSLPDFAKRLFR